MTEDNRLYDYGKIISGAGEAAKAAMGSATALATSKREAKEARRRTVANLLNQRLKRKQNLKHAGQEHSREMENLRGDALQEAAKGYIESLKGISGETRAYGEKYR
jgi:hypothetical protein